MLIGLCQRSDKAQTEQRSGGPASLLAIVPGIVMRVLDHFTVTQAIREKPTNNRLIKVIALILNAFSLTMML
ncbi:hypothetical protein [Halioxenophilus aromaticivorans]|uniref:hypothetical protein n=1 Tax=Halioxenophilus aromaticivorans TaxID=1306992 RepID=UPI0031EC29F2